MSEEVFLSRRRARRILRWAQLPAHVGLAKTQIEELIGREEFPRPFPAYEGARNKCFYEDEVASWQLWRDARLEGTTELTWTEWFKRYGDDGEDGADE
jgi:predicted DNA-binding transcriptional regulator AlpA